MSVYYCICTPSGFWTAVINVIIKKSMKWLSTLIQLIIETVLSHYDSLSLKIYNTKFSDMVTSDAQE